MRPVEQVAVDVHRHRDARVSEQPRDYERVVLCGDDGRRVEVSEVVEPEGQTLVPRRAGVQESSSQRTAREPRSLPLGS